jgi:phosphocarrier protein HPr
MPSTEITITGDVGLHARPAARFVKLAASFPADIRVQRGERTADAKSLVQVLQLEAGKGAVITIEAEGEDAIEALEALEELLSADAH